MILAEILYFCYSKLKANVQLFQTFRRSGKYEKYLFSIMTESDKARKKLSQKCKRNMF